MATEKEIEKALIVLSAAYPRFELPQATINIYQRLLSDLDFDILKSATLQCATMCKFFPTVAEIRDAAVEIITMSEGIPSALEAWGEIIREIKRVGSDKRPTFSHPLIDSVVHEFNWRYLCTSENTISDRARVMDAYEKMVKKSLREKQMLPEVLDIVAKRLEARPQQALLIPEKIETQEAVREVIPMPDEVRARMSKLFARENVR
jgi:hypothetical protein